MGSIVRLGLWDEKLEVKIKLIAILKYIFFLLVTDVVVDHFNIESCCSYEVSSWPKVFVSKNCSSWCISIMESYGRFSFKSTYDFCYWETWWYLELKMNMIFHKMSFEFFYFHFSQKIIKNVSELSFISSIYNFLAVLWAKYYMVATIKGSMSHKWRMKKGYDSKHPSSGDLCLRDTIITFFLVHVGTVEPRCFPHQRWGFYTGSGINIGDKSPPQLVISFFPSLRGTKGELCVLILYFRFFPVEATSTLRRA